MQALSDSSEVEQQSLDVADNNDSVKRKRKPGHGSHGQKGRERYLQRIERRKIDEFESENEIRIEDLVFKQRSHSSEEGNELENKDVLEEALEKALNDAFKEVLNNEATPISDFSSEDSQGIPAKALNDEVNNGNGDVQFLNSVIDELSNMNVPEPGQPPLNIAAKNALEIQDWLELSSIIRERFPNRFKIKISGGSHRNKKLQKWLIQSTRERYEMNPIESEFRSLRRLALIDYLLNEADEERDRKLEVFSYLFGSHFDEDVIENMTKDLSCRETTFSKCDDDEFEVILERLNDAFGDRNLHSLIEAAELADHSQYIIKNHKHTCLLQDFKIVNDVNPRIFDIFEKFLSSNKPKIEDKAKDDKIHGIDTGSGATMNSKEFDTRVISVRDQFDYMSEDYLESECNIMMESLINLEQLDGFLETKADVGDAKILEVFPEISEYEDVTIPVKAAFNAHNNIIKEMKKELKKELKLKLRKNVKKMKRKLKENSYFFTI